VTGASIDRREAERLTVADVMVKRPKAVQRDERLGEVRRLFAKPTLRTLVVLDGDAFYGTLERGDLPQTASDDAPAAEFVRTGVETVAPDVPFVEAMPLLEGNAEGRLVVVDRDGMTLRGLLCLRGDTDELCLDG